MGRYHRGDPEWTGSVLFGFLALSLLGAVVLLADKFGVAIWVVIGGITAVLTSRAVAAARAKKREEIEKSKCQHGVVGAIWKPDGCAICRKILELEQRQKRAEKLEEHLDRLEERRGAYKKWKAEVRIPTYLQEMDWKRFEMLVGECFQRMGYSQEMTPHKDRGIDILLRQKEDTFLVQCKGGKQSVGRPVLQQLFGNLCDVKAKGSFLVTTGAITREAREWANGKPIVLVELEELTVWIREYFEESAVVPAWFEVKKAPLVPKWQCPQCGLGLREILGKNGKFLGCMGYPLCSYTRSKPSFRKRHF